MKKDKVIVNLPLAILDDKFDKMSLTPQMKEDYLNFVIDSRTEEEKERQLFYKEKLNNIKSVDINENIELNLNKIELLHRIKKEIKELKAFILSARLSNTEFADYYEVYCRFEELSLLYSYLKEDTIEEKTNIK